MSRGPLEVLRELLDFEERHAEYEPRANHEGREAIAQVEALVEAATSWLDAAMESNHGITRKELQALQLTMRVLTPFTPGQDSEGGDGR